MRSLCWYVSFWEDLVGRHSIAYLVLAHSDPVHLRRLLKRLQRENVAFYVHIDGKADIDPFKHATADIEPIYFCEPRVKVTWAAFSVVEATLRILEMALAHEDLTCNRFVLLSGADYPIASNEEINHFFSLYPEREFIRGFSLVKSDKYQAWKVRGWHFRELAPRNSWLRPPLFALERTLRLFPRRLPDLMLVCGSQWWGLTRACAQFCVDFSRSAPDLVGPFKSMFAPDEIFFHTAVHNSPYAAQADLIEPFADDVTKSGSLRFYANLHYLPGDWIHTLDNARAALEARPRKLFARKFASDHSYPALKFIDQNLDVLAVHPESV
jgi:hypothetical protein